MKTTSEKPRIESVTYSFDGERILEMARAIDAFRLRKGGMENYVRRICENSDSATLPILTNAVITVVGEMIGFLESYDISRIASDKTFSLKIYMRERNDMKRLMILHMLENAICHYVVGSFYDMEPDLAEERSEQIANYRNFIRAAKQLLA